MRDRPLGVTILAVLIMLLGVRTVCGGLLDIVPFGLPLIGGIFGASSSALFNLVWGTLAILLGLGLWRLLSIAWLGTVIVLVVRLAFFVYALIGPPGVDWIGMLITLALLVYMIRPGVKGRFAG